MPTPVRSAALALLVAAPLAARADDPKPAAPRPAAALPAAYTLARVGRETKSPEMLLAAARVIGTTAVGKPDDPADKTDPDAVRADLLADALALVADAKAVGGATADAVAALAAAVEKDIREVKRGPGLPPKMGSGAFDKAPADATYVFHLPAGRRVSVGLLNVTGRGDLELAVTDPDGKPVNAPRRVCDEDDFVAFTPAKAGLYRMKVTCHDLGKQKTVRYRLVIDQP